MKHRGKFAIVMSLALALLGVTAATDGQAVVCTTGVGGNTITAEVVVLDNPTVFNRLGAQNPNWITYALKRDVVRFNPATGLPDPGDVPGQNLVAGNVILRPDKRPRPLVVRSVAGMCLQVTFTNLLDPNRANPVQPPDPRIQDNLVNDDQVADRCAGFHAQGVEVVDLIKSDGSMVGNNPGANINAGQCGGGLVAPGGSITYKLYTPHEGTFVVNSYGATIGSEQNSGNLGLGMFAQLNVEPKGARIYRSQVTEEELRLATVGTVPSTCTGATGEVPGKTCNPGGQPVINYEKLYPNEEPWISEGKAGLPILKMLTASNVLVHSDINAIIAGPCTDGSWTCKLGTADSPYPLEKVGKNVPSLPNRLEPFREYSSIFHDEQTNSQVFPRWYTNPVLKYTLAGVKDQFMINYGSGGIGSEIIANRLNTGPMHDCPSCAYEEFFLASQTVGDPGMLVDFPANTLIEQCDPTNIAAGPDSPNACWRNANLSNGPITRLPDPNAPGGFVNVRNVALYQEDPSNVHNGYTGDFVKIRNIHAGAFEQHIFHLHNHQWLFNPNDDNGNYLDAQEIMPGSGHTYELVNGGAGNRNKTVGDAIFHCHFYPHFAQGMWYHIRNHDVFERGTVLAVSNANDAQNPTSGFHNEPFALRSGLPKAGARALPDGELPDGSPIPAIVPLPGKPMPHMPAKVSIVAVDRGGFSLLGGRVPADGIFESGQAVVKRFCNKTPADCADAVAGLDNVIGTPDDVTPGFPFWIAGNECGIPTVDGQGNVLNPCPLGIVGQRAPTPPLDMLTELGATANGYAAAQAGGWDGGLPRHALLGYTSGGATLNTQNRLDFSKIIEMAQPVYFPETGTDLEKVSMAYQAVRERLSAAQNLAAAGGGVTQGAGVNFVLNGAPPVPGGPFSDPCIDDNGIPLTGQNGAFFDGDGNPATFATTGQSAFTSGNPRTYKVANVQIDAVFNKVGYHYPQERIISLWEDVAPHVLKQRPPEPLVMRFNTFDCGKILHTNLVPGEFELDDFQVRTPTDIIGQHIHLPKWDLTTNDGAANGWNYEDGTIAPDIIVERIKAINEFNHLAGQVVGPNCTLAAALAGAKDPDTGELLCPIPGQLAPINLAGLSPVPTLTEQQGADPGSPSLVGRNPTDNLVAAAHPFFGDPANANPQTPHYKGARTTIQRLFMDPLVNVAGVDRGLGLTFSHDHYGPSSFQQIGLYSTILAEPAGSEWKHNETGAQIGWLANGNKGFGRDDGGPTTWQAAIITPDLDTTINGKQNPVPDHREFYFEMSDFQHAYEAGVYVGANAYGMPVFTDNIVQPNPFDVTVAFVGNGPDGQPLPLANSWRLAVNPPLKVRALPIAPATNPFPDVVKAEPLCPGGQPRPCAEAINIGHSSMWVTNYRNEPVGLRVFDPNKIGPDGKQGTQADGQAGDLAFALQSRIDRAIPDLNTSFGAAALVYPPAPYCSSVGDLINCDRQPGDPFTPIMRAYERDEVKIKIQVGATEEQHQATVHGMKWLSNGSGFGRSPNSGWRNFQSHGISEQFSLQIPLNPDLGQNGNKVDYLYSTDATRDGFWSGTWGILRSYGVPQSDLVALPDNPQNLQARVTNAQNFAGVCPRVLNPRTGQPTNQIANLVQYDVTAVLANEVLPNNLGVTIDNNSPTGNRGVGQFVNDNEGGPLNPNGGTLVYNRRGTTVPGVTVGVGAEAAFHPGGSGPLNDPTAILYVRTTDLQFAPCVAGQPCRTTRGNPVGLLPNAPVEPLVLRAKAGDCVEVTLRNALPFTQATDLVTGVVTNVPSPMPDLAGWQDLFWVVNRELFQPARGNEMHFFNNNLVRPSSYVGLHAQLVEFDSSRDDGVVVGQNAAGQAVVSPGAQKLYRWYAGDIQYVFTGVRNGRREFRIDATPVEFGATNLLSADRVKQPQKGLFGALVIEPAGATYPDTLAQLTAAGPSQQVPDGQANEAVTPLKTRLTRAQVTVTSAPGPAGSGGTFREALSIGHKIANLRWKDGTAIANVNQNELGREGSEDSGHAGFNYGMEPPWFRFKLPPDVPFGNAGTPGSYGAIANAHAMYSNKLVEDNVVHPNTIPAIPGVSALGDPVTPVFRATADTGNLNPRADTRMYVLNGASADRDGTFIVHGHLWQKDPYVCPNQSNLGLVGRCNPDEKVPSRALGFNEQGKWMGSQEGMGHAYGYWPILFDAGGTNRVPGDYLYRDYSPSGNRNGQFGIFRVSAN